MNLLYKVTYSKFFPFIFESTTPHGICNHRLIEGRASAVRMQTSPLRLLHADRHAKELRVLCAGEGPTTTHGSPQILWHTPSGYGPQICQFFLFFWGWIIYLFI